MPEEPTTPVPASPDPVDGAPAWTAPEGEARASLQHAAAELAPDAPPSGPPIASPPPAGAQPLAQPLYGQYAQPDSRPNPYQQSYQQAYPQPYSGYPVAPVQPKTMSIVSMVLSLVGFFVTGPLTLIPGAIVGHIALRKEPAGRPFALTGVIVGWIGTGFWVIGIILYAVFISWALTTYPGSAS